MGCKLIKYSKNIYFSTNKKFFFKHIRSKNNKLTLQKYILKKYFIFFIIKYFFIKQVKILSNIIPMYKRLFHRWTKKLFLNQSYSSVSFYFLENIYKDDKCKIYVSFRPRNLFLNFLIRDSVLYYSINLLKRSKYKYPKIKSNIFLLKLFIIIVAAQLQKKIQVIFNRISLKIGIILNLLIYHLKFLNFKKLKRSFFFINSIKFKNSFKLKFLKQKKKPRKRKVIRKRTIKRYIY